MPRIQQCVCGHSALYHVGAGTACVSGRPSALDGAGPCACRRFSPAVRPAPTLTMRDGTEKPVVDRGAVDLGVIERLIALLAELSPRMRQATLAYAMEHFQDYDERRAAAEEQMLLSTMKPRETP